MGLDFSHGDAGWSCSGFNRFRRKLASIIGLDLDSMRGFGGNVAWNRVNCPIKILLNHSDNSGSISAKNCVILAPILREMMLKMPYDFDDRNAAHDLENGNLLADGMEAAAKEEKSLRFR